MYINILQIKIFIIEKIECENLIKLIQILIESVIIFFAKKRANVTVSSFECSTPDHYQRNIQEM